MLRGKILLWALLLTGVAAALLGIAQMWWEPLAWDVFIKSLVTLLIIGTLASFLSAVDYDLPGSRGKIVLGLLVVLAVIGSGLIIGQMWWHFLGTKTFGKMLITVIILAGLLSFFAAVSEDFGTAKKLKDGKFID